MRSIRLLALYAAVLAALPAAAALQVRQTIKAGDGSAPVERKLISSGSKVRIDEGTTSLIFDSATGKIVLVDHATKTWRESPLKNPLSPTQDAASTRYAEAFAASTALVADSGAISVRPSTETRTIAGVPAKRVDVYRNGILVRRSWHAASVEDGDLVNAQGMLATSDLAPLFIDDLTVATRTATIGHTVRIEDVATGDSMEAVEIRKDAPAATVFAPPAGYRKVD